MSSTLIVGGTRGIGAAWAELLRKRGENVWTASRNPQGPQSLTVDVCDADSIQVMADNVLEQAPDLQTIIYTVGLLHDGELQPEKSLRQFDPTVALRSYQVNALGPTLLAKAFWGHLRKTKPVRMVSLSARVGSISDNRLGGWHSYRASKAAQNMLLTNVAIELKRLNPQALIAMMHPGTVDTDLSKPFQKAVPDGKLFTVQLAAAQLDEVLNTLEPSETGVFVDWDHQRINF